LPSWPWFALLAPKICTPRRDASAVGARPIHSITVGVIAEAEAEAGRGVVGG
jgi:hypothetical protein